MGVMHMQMYGSISGMTSSKKNNGVGTIIADTAVHGVSGECEADEHTRMRGRRHRRQPTHPLLALDTIKRESNEHRRIKSLSPEGRPPRHPCIRISESETDVRVRKQQPVVYSRELFLDEYKNEKFPFEIIARKRRPRATDIGIVRGKSRISNKMFCDAMAAPSGCDKIILRRGENSPLFAMLRNTSDESREICPLPIAQDGNEETPIHTKVWIVMRDMFRVMFCHQA
ncbi:hypothetical protein ACHAWF_016708 [Thalassiosira exigua]